MSRTRSAAWMNRKNFPVLGLATGLALLAGGCGSKGDDDDAGGGGQFNVNVGGNGRTGGNSGIVYSGFGGRNFGSVGGRGYTAGTAAVSTGPTTCVPGTIGCACYTSQKLCTGGICNANNICVAGVPGAGGATGTGGSKSTGSGAVGATGGVSIATGGASSVVLTGGASSVLATGGTSAVASSVAATGGALPVGGTSSLVAPSGGAAATGGVPAAGGTLGVGGVVGTGGSSSTSIEECNNPALLNTPNGAIDCVAPCALAALLTPEPQTSVAYDCNCTGGKYVCSASEKLSTLVACPAQVALSQDVACNNSVDLLCALDVTVTAGDAGAGTTTTKLCSCLSTKWSCADAI